MSEAFFITKELTVGHNGKPLIRDIEVELKRGKILTLIGPNGAGKTTILRSLTRHLKKIAGTVFIGGKDLHQMSGNAFSKRLSVVLTDRVRTERMTCAQVVEMGRYPYTGTLGILSEEDRREVAEAMNLVNITELKDRDFMHISDGQKQRVMIARALCQRPEVIVLDEPTSFLDIRFELELLEILRNLAKERGITIIMSLHNLMLAQRISDEVMCVKGDYISFYGTAAEVFTPQRISELYDIDEGNYNPLFGSIEMCRPLGEPKLFVIAGAGTGIAAYRALQKEKIAFVTGILHPEDIDYQVARGLASEILVTPDSYDPITEEAFAKAMKTMHQCDVVWNCLTQYGYANQRNQVLFAEAIKMGKKVINNISEF